MDMCDISSIQTHFPHGAKVPKRLIELAEWLDLTIDTTEEYFPEIRGDTLEDWVDVDISPYFGVFMHLGDGSVVAYWFYEGVDLNNPPIVVLTSDGDIGVAANSIEEFVSRIIEDRFPDEIWVDYMSALTLYADGAWIQNLKEWVENKWNLTSEKRKQLTSFNPEQNHPYINEWIKSFIN
jgi:hypothetical protein